MNESASVESSVEGLVGQIAGEFTDRIQRGEQPSVEEYARRHPEIADLLRQVLPALQVMGSSASAGEDDGVETDAPAAEGRLLGDYRILREVGRGGMGIVYEAQQVSLNRRVALKVLPFAATLDRKRLQRFQNEAQAAAQLHHTNIVPVHTVGRDRGVHYYAMQYIDGQTLAAVIDQLRADGRPAPEGDARSGTAGALAAELTSGRRAATQHPAPSSATLAGDAASPSAETVTGSAFAVTIESARKGRDFFRTVAKLGLQAAEALEYAHEQGVVHRDIKPANLLLDVRGHLWVTDFGLAQVQRESGLTLTGDLVGTLRYMSPEQALAKHELLDHRTDVYSLGATLYELLTLRPAVSGGDRQELLRRIAFEEPVSPRRVDPAIPAELATIVLKAMEKSPAERYPTAQELADDLRHFLENRPIRARPVTLPERLWRWCRRNPSVAGSAFTAAGAVLFAVAVVVVSNVLIARKDRERAAADAEREIAAVRELSARRSQYVSEFTGAVRLWETGRIDLAKEVLARLRPEPGQVDLRGFEWRYLWRFCDGLGTALRGHEEEVYGVGFSPDGKKLVTASRDRTVKVWDLATGQPPKTFRGHTNDVNCVAYSPDGKTIASADDDGRIRLWDSTTGEPRGLHSGHADAVVGVAFSADGKVLASADSAGNIVVQDIAAGTRLWTKQAHRERLHQLAASRDRKLLATVSKDQTARLWEFSSGKEVARLDHPFEVHAVAFSPNSARLATCCGLGCIFTWNTDKPFERFSHSMNAVDPVRSLAFSPNGATLASIGNNGRIKLWQVDKLVKSFRADWGWCVGFSPDGRTLATTHRDKTVHLWDLSPASGAPEGFKFIDNRATHLEFSPDGKTLLVGASHTPHASRSSISSWDTQIGRPLSDAIAVDVAELLATGFGPKGWMAAHLSPGNPSTVIVRHGDRGGRALVLDQGETVTCAAFSPDGKSLAVHNRSKVILWDLASGRERVAFALPEAANAMAFSPDGKTVALGSWLGVNLWVPETGEVRTTKVQHDGHLNALAFSPDGGTVATASYDQTATLCDVVKGEVRFTLRGRTDRVHAVAFTPDGKTLATGSTDGTVNLWNVATGQELLTLPVGTPVWSLAFSPDGTMLATGASINEIDEAQVKLWLAPVAETGDKPR